MSLLNIGHDVLPAGSGFGTNVYIAVDGIFAGMIEVADEPKEDAKVVFDLLRKEGVERFIMLTGDSETVARAVASKAGIDEVHAKLLPEQKVDELEKILESSKMEKLPILVMALTMPPY